MTENIRHSLNEFPNKYFISMETSAVSNALLDILVVQEIHLTLALNCTSLYFPIQPLSSSLVSHSHEVTESTRELIKDSTHDLKNLAQFQTVDPKKAVSVVLYSSCMVSLTRLVLRFSANVNWNNKSFPRISKKYSASSKKYNDSLPVNNVNMWTRQKLLQQCFNHSRQCKFPLLVPLFNEIRIMNDS